MTEVWCLKQTAYEDEHNAMPEWYRADDGVWTSLSNQSHPRQPAKSNHVDGKSLCSREFPRDRRPMGEFRLYPQT